MSWNRVLQNNPTMFGEPDRDEVYYAVRNWLGSSRRRTEPMPAYVSAVLRDAGILQMVKNRLRKPVTDHDDEHYNFKLFIRDADTQVWGASRAQIAQYHSLLQKGS